MVNSKIGLNNLKQHQKFWDNVAFSIGDMMPFNMDAFHKFVPNKRSAILDLGCGYGRTMNEVYKNGYDNLVGVDISSRMIERGKRDFSFLRLIYTSDHLSVLEKNSFDAVVLLGVFTCIAEDKQQIELIENILKLLKKGGIIYISDFLLNNDERNVNRYNKLQNMYDGYSYGVFELNEGLLFRHHSYEWICKLLSPFKKLYYQEKKYKTLNNHVGNGFVYMGKRV